MKLELSRGPRVNILGLWKSHWFLMMNMMNATLIINDITVLLNENL